MSYHDRSLSQSAADDAAYPLDEFSAHGRGPSWPAWLASIAMIFAVLVAVVVWLVPSI